MSDVASVVHEAIAEHCTLDDKKHEEIKNLFILEMKNLNQKIDKMAPTIKEINDFKTAYRITGNFLAGMIKVIISVTLISGAIYGLKEWIRK